MHVAHQAAADRIAQSHQHRGFRRCAGDQRLVRAIDGVDADRRRVDIGDEQVKRSARRCASPPTTSAASTAQRKRPSWITSRDFLQEDAVAQQAAADAGDEGEHESAHHVVAALGGRPDPGQREQEYRRQIELDRQQERDADHAAMVALLIQRRVPMTVRAIAAALSLVAAALRRGARFQQANPGAHRDSLDPERAPFPTSSSSRATAPASRSWCPASCASRRARAACRRWS